MNKISIFGRITRDIEIKTTPSGVEYANFSVAVDRPKQKDKESEADFFNCTVWRSTAAFVQKYFHRGDAIIVHGSMQMSKKDDKTYWTLMVDSNGGIEFPIGSKKSDNNSAGSTSTESAPTFSDIAEETGDLPF